MQLTNDGQSFKIEGFDLPENSQITVSYVAYVSDTEALSDALQEGIDGDAISGTYAGQEIDGSNFELSLVDNELVFQFLGEARGDGPYVGALTLAFTLPTHVIQGKQTIDLTNKARLVGETKHSYEWQNEARGVASNYGGQLEQQKHVYSGDKSGRRICASTLALSRDSQRRVSSSIASSSSRMAPTLASESLPLKRSCPRARLLLVL